MVKLQSLCFEFVDSKWRILKQLKSILIEQFQLLINWKWIANQSKTEGLLRRFSEDRIKEEEDTLFFTSKGHDVPVDEVWYIDSGCSNHMIGNNKAFEELDESTQTDVRTGDDKRIFTKGVVIFLYTQRKESNEFRMFFMFQALSTISSVLDNFCWRIIKSTSRRICAKFEKNMVLSSPR